MLVIAATGAVSPSSPASPPAGGTGAPPRVLEVVVVPKAQPPRHATSSRAKSSGLEILLPAAGAAFLLLLALRARAWFARRRRCGSCGARMALLERAAAFAHLDLGERTEELVGDVHYDVWECPACAGIEKQGMPRRHSVPAGALAAPPVGSASYLRGRHRGGLSLWSSTGDPGTKSPADAATPPPSVSSDAGPSAPG